MAELSVKKPIPSESSITAATDIASTPEAADYLFEQFRKLMKDSGSTIANASKPIQTFLENFRELVHLQYASSGNHWAGIRSHSDFEKLHENIAAQSAAELAKETTTPIRIDIAISDLAQIIRSFKAAGNSLSADGENQLDRIINAFFAQYQLISKGGVLYETNEKGALIYENNTPKKADPEQVKELLTRSREGLKSYLESKGVEVEVIKNHKYPEPRPIQEQEITPQETPQVTPQSGA